MSKPKRTLRNAGVRFPPPFFFVGGFLVGWFLDRHVVALPLVRGDPSGLQGIGWLLVIAGAFIVVWGLTTFIGAQTAIIPHRPASRIVTGGPYRYTRNPMYGGFTVAYAGLCAAFNSWWFVLLLPIVLTLIVRRVIWREEAYLADAFPSEYAAYRARVRRWL